ncbi:MAG: lamin tail domain-containing protein, partial [Planctomycetota bacterium]
PIGFIRDYWKGGRAYDDSAWAVSTGHPGGVGYETNSGYEELISFDVEQQMYEKQSTCYIRIPFTIGDDLSEFELLTLKVRYDDGFIAYINGTEVRRANFAGVPDWDSSADAGHPDSESIHFESFDISDFIDILRQGDNLLAIHGLNSSSDSSDFLISVEMVIRKNSSSSEAVSPSVVEYTRPVELTESCIVKTRIFSNGAWSPLNGAVFSVGPIADNLRITEIMYHPQEAGNPDDPNTEFLELRNIGGEKLNLNMVSFSEGIRFTFPGIELLPGEYVLLVKDISAFETKYGPGLNVAGEYSGSLSNGGERIVLKDAAGLTIHDFSYSDDWYPSTDGMGFSLTVKDPAATHTDNWGDKSTWHPSVGIGGSPGYGNP